METRAQARPPGVLLSRLPNAQRGPHEREESKGYLARFVCALFFLHVFSCLMIGFRSKRPTETIRVRVRWKGSAGLEDGP